MDNSMEIKEVFGSADPYIPLESPMREKAEEELGETQEGAVQCLADLRKMMEEDGGFRCPTDTESLIKYLRATKFDTKKALNKMKRRLQCRNDYPEFFFMKTLDEIHRMAMDKFVILLPDRAENGALIALIRSSPWDPEIYPVNKLFNMAFLCFDFISQNPIAQVYGIIVVIDCIGVTMKKVLKHAHNPKYVFRIAVVGQHTACVRYPQIHILNENVLIHKIAKIISPFIPKKIFDRLVFHGNSLESLHQYISPNILPEEYGGETGPLSYEYTWQQAKDCNEKQLLVAAKMHYVGQKKKKK